jgi:hypothetical protein
LHSTIKCAILESILSGYFKVIFITICGRGTTMEEIKCLHPL